MFVIVSLLLLAQSSEDSLQFGNITLIQHIDVDAVRLRTLIGGEITLSRVSEVWY